MNSSIRLAAVVSAAALVAHAANVAPVTLFCGSVAIHPGTYRSGGQTSYLEFSSDGVTLNDELVFSAASADPTSLSSNGLLTTSAGTTQGVVYMSIPDEGDANKNGINDFYEPAHAVNTATTGRILFDDGMGDSIIGYLTATWSRSANATSGGLQLRANIPDLGVNETFTHRFDIFAYSGALTYSTNGTGATGTVRLAAVGTPSLVVTGPMTLTATNSDNLGYAAAQWSLGQGASSFPLALNSSDSQGLGIQRRLGNQYLGLVYFDNGPTPLAFEAPYSTWFFQIADPNDANKNGIPDLSDVPDTRVAPQLSVTLDSSGTLQITITAAAGQAVTLEHAMTPDATTWDLVQSLTLSGVSQTVPVTLPADAAGFYRAR